MRYSIESVAAMMDARRMGEAQGCVSFLLTDSRSLCFPEETLFFALRSCRNDGHRYIADLYARGVRHFVVSSLPGQWQQAYPQASFLLVSDTLKALQLLASHHRNRFGIPIVGITGSNGKTMVKEWLYQVVSPDKSATRSPRSYNSQTGVPLSVWLLESQSQVGIFEAGISRCGEMQPLHDIIRPTLGVLTMLGEAHQENFSSMEEKCREKLRLFAGTEALVFPQDDKLVTTCLAEASYGGERLGWSRRDKLAALYIACEDKQPTQTTVQYAWRGKAASYTLPFIDNASVENSFAVAAAALQLGVTAEQLAERMEHLEPVGMRLEVKQGNNGCTLINDAYNSDIHSLDIALDFMSRRPDHQGRKRTLILSDILQSGEQPEVLYAKVADLILKRGVERLVGIGADISSQAQAFGNIKEASFFASVDSFVGSTAFRTLRNEVILLKGARRFGFERITELLVKKVHETTLEVNLGAVVDNLNHYRAMMHPETKLTCMIKADAYGAGAVEIAKTLQDHRVDYLAVAVADEGVTLRRNGITSNIMVMNPEMTAFKTMFDYDLEPEVYSFRLLDALIKAAGREGITGYPVHIKLETGMCRLGFNPLTDIDALIERLQSQRAVIPRSVFSHFAGADTDRLDDFSQRQFELFDAGSRKLQAAFPHKIIRHIDNSAGIDHFRNRQLDMCRLGIGLYGIDPRTNQLLHNVSTLKTTILQLRHVPKGTSVGYGRHTILTRDSVIAAIPIGYADGLSRHLGNRHGHCLVNGVEADYVGNICMDVCMVDVTDISCQEGDSVEIFGDHLPVTRLSDALDTIPYEVLTGISNRVKRVYFQD